MLTLWRTGIYWSKYQTDSQGNGIGLGFASLPLLMSTITHAQNYKKVQVDKYKCLLFGEQRFSRRSSKPPWNGIGFGFASLALLMSTITHAQN